MSNPRITDASAFGRVAVLMGGWSAERAVSLDSGAAVGAALQRRGVDVTMIDVDQHRVLGLADEGFDRVWLALHGRGGEDGVVQGALELQGLPYTGSGVLACALSMDKVRTKALWAAQGIPTPAHRLLDANTESKAVVEALGLPLIVKPVHEGSTIGISKVERIEDLDAARAEAAKYDREVMAEQFVNGPEYTAAILDGRALPLIHIEPSSGFYDYEAKYVANDTLYHCPCDLEQGREAELQRLALRAFEITGATGWGRVDLMLDDAGQPWFLELNAIPGMTSHSLVPMAARAAGMDFDELVWRILGATLTTTNQEKDNELA
ncbi:D-alanine--D-alanine ligase [Salinisphaera shabanensis T35B1]|uniref:D-alanine--D-alanine ligase n=1 Tax=Salinisphaera shabanensis E1L3A TaxID=1033802 RepID=U2ESB5_9GAMM|nr:D-alanine--D-alanine ligase [Salinisphaera shabanensis]ERJ20585.1 D-alanine--D-alanine ligase B protein [Salinisphaera shabanensis E1L3A]